LAAPPASVPAAAPSPAASPASLANTIKWSTASEVDNFGYDVYRADSEDGPFTRLTKTPLPGAGTSDEVHKYQYVDTTNDPSRPYYYYVESISLAGVREKFTPVIHAKAKLPPASPAPTASPVASPAP
jgi:fibronectin type 3 domain-containing protein